MFQGEIDEIFKELPDVFWIVDDILVVGYDDNNGRNYANIAKSASNM